MASKIRIYRSTGATAPGSLEYGELAVTVEQGTAGTSANKAGRLFIGNASGNPVEIGGEYTYKLLDHTHGELINSSAVIVNDSGQIDGWSVVGILSATRTDIGDLVTNNLNVTGVSTFASGLNLNGNVVIGDSHTDTLTVNSRAGFNTDVTLNNNLLVSGITTITSGLIVENGGINVQNGGDSQFSDNVLVGLALTVQGGLTVSGDSGLTVASDGINVSGASTFNNHVDFTALTSTDIVGTAGTFTNAFTLGSGATKYSFPVTDGSADQILVTNGSGTLSFQDVSSTLVISAGAAGTDGVSLLSDVLTIAATNNETKTTLTDNTITVGLATDVIVGGGLTVTNNLLVLGNLTVEGTETVINVERLDVQDKTVGVASTSTADNTTANGAGFFVHGGGDGDKTIFWSLGQDGFEVNQNWLPNADDTYSLGNASREWKDIFVDGLAELDDVNVSAAATINTLNVTGTGTIATADINGGNIDDTAIGAGSSSTAIFTTLNSGTIVTGGRLDAGETTFSTLRVTGVSTVASLFFSTGTNTNGVGYFDASGQLQSTATPSAGIQTSNYILTTNASGVPSWTDTIDCGTF